MGITSIVRATLLQDFSNMQTPQHLVGHSDLTSQFKQDLAGCCVGGFTIDSAHQPSWFVGCPWWCWCVNSVYLVHNSVTTDKEDADSWRSATGNPENFITEYSLLWESQTERNAWKFPSEHGPMYTNSSITLLPNKVVCYDYFTACTEADKSSSFQLC
jgi:hypothetical protein